MGCGLSTHLGSDAKLFDWKSSLNPMILVELFSIKTVGWYQYILPTCVSMLIYLHARDMFFICGKLVL